MCAEKDHLSIISCQQCRRRKVKCGRQFPGCENCAKKGYRCQYPDTQRKTSTRLVRRHKYPNARYYGFSSVNRSLFEVGMPFCNIDFELEGKYSWSSHRFTVSEVFKKYIKEPTFMRQSLKLVKESASRPFFEQIVDLEMLDLCLESKKGGNFQILLLLYAVAILSERFYETPPDIDDLIQEFHLLLDDCPDCPEKVSSYVLLADYYHYNFKIEAAWKKIHLATSIGYALGLHVMPCKVWTMLVFLDSLLCSILGRPTSISRLDPDLIRNTCDGWGEIALSLRQFNDVLLDLESKESLERVISLEIKCDDIIEKTRLSLNSIQYDQNLKLLEYLKLLIMVSNQIKLLFPLFLKHNRISSRLDENCNNLSNLLCEVFQYLTETGLASEEKPFSLRPHFFPAYCCVFQAFLYQFLFTSSKLLKDSGRGKTGAVQAPVTKQLSPGMTSLSSLDAIASLLDNYDCVIEKIRFCTFMSDVFESFRTLLDRTAEDRLSVRSSENSEENNPYNKMFPLPGFSSGENRDASSPFADDIASWITSCLYDGAATLLSGEKPF